MPADVWAVQFPVGRRSTGEASRPAERNTTQPALARDRMAGQNRIDDTLLVREAQRGDRAAFENWCATTTRPSSAWRCT